MHHEPVGSPRTSNAGTPQAGDWQYVQIFGSGASSFAHCTFEYASDNLRPNDSDPSTSGCTVRHCSTGIHCYNASPTIGRCEITACNMGIRIFGNTSTPVVHHNKPRRRSGRPVEHLG